MTREEMEQVISKLLLERAKLARLNLELSPNDLMLLRRLAFRLGITNMKFARRSNVKRYARPTPESLRALAEAVSKNPDDQSLRHAYADEHEAAGNSEIAQALRNPKHGIHFFMKHGYGDPEGSLRLAKAESHLQKEQDAGRLRFMWHPDEEYDPNDYENPEDQPPQAFIGVLQEPRQAKTLHHLDPDDWRNWQTLSSLGGVTFAAPHDDPYSDPYHRVVQAEMMSEHMPEEKPEQMSRKGSPVRMAKIDGHAVAHPLVQGFPIETALRHLANDPNNHPSIRELAKVAVTGGKNGDGSNIPVALWALHDALHEHKHPAKDWYNYQSAADKIGLDAHTYRALREVAEQSRASTPPGWAGTGDEAWHQTPESFATDAARAIDVTGHANLHEHRIGIKNRVVARIKQLSPSASDSDIQESIRRHAHRAQIIWQRDANGENYDDSREKAHDLVPLKKFDQMLGNGTYALKNEKATRYSRLLHKLRYALGEGRSSRHIGGEEMFSHDYDGGVANVIPRNEGQTLHVDYVGPKDAQPGQLDRLNTLGTGKVRRLVTALKAKYPNAKFLTGIRPSGRRVLRKLAKRRYQMVAGDFLDALRRIRSSDQEAVKKSMEEIAAKLGAKPASTVNALHDSPNYSVPGVAMAIYSNLAPEKVQALAAWGALTGNIPGNAVFHVRPDGPDLLHRFRMQGSGHDLRARMDKAGLVSRILIPHRTGFDVMIPDKGGSLRDRVKGFVQQQKVELQTSRGHFKTIGSSDQARAREMFRNAIVKQEKSAPERPTMRNRLKGMLVRMARRGQEGYISPEGKFHEVTNGRHIDVAERLAGAEARSQGLDPRRVLEAQGYMHVGAANDGLSMHGFHPERQFTPEQISTLKQLASDSGAGEVTLDGKGRSVMLR